MLPAIQTVRRWFPLAIGIALGLTFGMWTSVQASALIPGLLLTSVNSGLVVSGVVPLTARADAVGFSSLQFQVSGQNVGPNITAGGCVTSWDTRAFSNGVHTVTAVARDSTGNTVFAPPTLVTVLNIAAGQADTTPPSVGLTAPANGSFLSGHVTIAATAADNAGIASVWFTVDGSTIGFEDTTAPYSVVWVTHGTGNGAHVVRAVARDTSGNTAGSATHSVTVNNSVAGGVVSAGIAGDLNGDSRPDLLFEHAGGQLHAWFMNGSNLIADGRITPSSVNAAWRVVGVDDFNGDGRSDVLWQHASSREVYVWYMNGTTMIGAASVANTAPGWRVAATGDLNGDGDTDLVWQHRTTGEVYVWLMNRLTPGDTAPLSRAMPDKTWQVAGSADIDRDGKSDVLWQNSVTGAVVVSYMNRFTVKSTSSLSPAAVNPEWHIKAAADFDLDGHADLVWQHRRTGHLYIWYLKGASLVSSGYLRPGQVDVAWELVGS